MIKKLFIVVAAVMIGALSAHVDGRAQGSAPPPPRREGGLYSMPVRGTSSSSSAQGRTSRCRSAVLDRSSSIPGCAECRCGPGVSASTDQPAGSSHHQHALAR